MSKRILFAMFGGVVAYVVVALVAYFLVGMLSTNTHDRALEAGMSAAFFYGPAGAIVGGLLGWKRGGRVQRPLA